MLAWRYYRCSDKGLRFVRQMTKDFFHVNPGLCLLWSNNTQSIYTTYYKQCSIHQENRSQDTPDSIVLDAEVYRKHTNLSRL